jgi:two-component system cell cycle sensor histidine kinase/response regulator CckA
MKRRSLSKIHYIALALAITIPTLLSLFYFSIRYIYIDTTLRIEAKVNGFLVSQIINSNPEYWRFEDVRLHEFLSRSLNFHNNETRRIVDIHGTIIAEHRNDIEHPFMIRSYPVYDSGNVVARLEIIRSLRPMLYSTALVGLCGYLFAGVIYLAIKKFVLDARQQAEAALLESEQKYRLLVNQMPGLVYIGYADWAVDFFDDKVYELTGYHKDEFDSRRIKWSEVILAEDLPSAKNAFIQSLKSNKSYTREYRIQGKGGAILWIHERGQIICQEDGGIAYVSGMFFDITERKFFEEERLMFNKMESLGVLAGGIAHDFNNILTVILGSINLATLELPSGNPGQDILSEAEKACFQAQSLARQLLTFAKGGTPVKGPVSAKNLIIESATFACRGSQVRSEFVLPNDLWTIEADAGQINQVFQNLIINAVQAMPRGGTIKIRAENLAEPGQNLPLSPGRYVKISLQDQGLGVSAENLSKIFDPYFTTKRHGSGLGLATTYSIIKNHNGHITAESKIGVGSTFSIYLPAIDRKIVSQPAESGELFPGKGKILVMDDDDLVRTLLVRMIAHLGYEAELARDGREAINIFTEAQESGNPFDAVILDLTVPGGMGGKEALARLLEIDPQVKAIASSGYSDDPIMADFRKYGFTAIIPKPYTVAEASRVLHEIVIKK